MEHRDQRTFSAFSVLIVFLVCCLIGLAIAPLLSVQLLPNRTYASVTVSCNMSGASQEVVEREITNPIEGLLAHLSGIKSISSTTRTGTTSVRVELDKWTDPEMFRFEVSAQLRQLQNELPENASYPQVSLNRPRSSSYRSSMLGYSLNGPGHANELAKYVEERIQPVLAQIDGISEVSIAGTKSERFTLVVDVEKLREAGIAHRDVVSALNQGRSQYNLGIVNDGERSIEVRIEGELNALDQLARFPITHAGNRIVRLQDVADIKKGFAEPRSYYRINGQDLVNISIFPEEQVNTLRLAHTIKKQMSEIQSSLPEGHRLTLNYDTTEYLKEELGKIYVRTGLSIAILLAFVLLITRKLRYLMLVIVSIAANILISFIFYYAFDLEIHLYSLAGITISIGLIIDNVIVIVEDIRHTGRNRIFAAILASTFTALGALSVIFLLEESQRLNLMDFALAIIINLLVSLPVAYYFIPALIETFPVGIKHHTLMINRRRRLVRFRRLYFGQIQYMLKHKWAFILLIILSFGLPLFMLPDKIEKPGILGKAYNAVFDSDFYKEMLKEPIHKYLGGATYLYLRGMDSFGPRDTDEESDVRLYVNISMPNGATLQQMNQITRGFERYLSGFPEEIDVFTARVSSANAARIEIAFEQAYKNGFPHRLKSLLETEAIMSGSADFRVYGVGRGFSNALNLQSYDSSIALKGYNYPQLQQIALQVRDTLLKNPRVADVYISPDAWHVGKPLQEYRVQFTRSDQLVLYNIGRGRMSDALYDTKAHESSMGTIMHNGEQVQLAVATHADVPPKVWSTLEDPLPVNDSVMRRLSDLTTLSNVRLGSAIKRRNQEYLLNVHYRFIGSYQLNSIIQQRVVEHVNEDIPYGYSVYVPRHSRGWGSKETRENLWFIGLVLLIIYMICAILLESFRQPLAVILMIPFSFIGVFLMFYILQLKFDQGGYAALLLLSGLVTNVALYIINDINFIKQQYTFPSWEEKIKIYMKAFNAKAMPILVTTASAVLSLLPFMLNGQETGFWFTLSAGTIGGLIFSLLGAYLMLPLALLRKSRKNEFKRI